MQTFARSYGTFDDEQDGRKSGTMLFIGAMRRDGKYPVTFAYGSGKRIAKVFTVEQLEAEIAKLENRS
jgi:hypothetical protein